MLGVVLLIEVLLVRVFGCSHFLVVDLIWGVGCRKKTNQNRLLFFYGMELYLFIAAAPLTFKIHN